MHAEDALPDHGCDGEEVEGVGNDFPQSRVESAFALIEEAIQFVEFTGLVVAPQQEEGAGVAHFVGEEKEDALQGLLAPIYVVPQEEVVFAGGGAEDAEDGEQVLELSVYVSADLHWSFEFEEHGLFLEDAAGHGAEPFDLVFFEDLKFVCPGGSLADANDNIVDIEHLLLACQHRNRTEFSYTTAIIDPRLLPHHSLTEDQQQPIHSPVAWLDPFSIAHLTQPTPTPEALPLLPLNHIISQQSMHSFLQDIDSWDHSLPRWPDPNYGPLLPTHKISRKQTRRPRPPLSDIQNLPRCPFPSDLSSLSQFKLKMRQLQQQSDRWQHPATGEHFQKHTRSGLIRAHTQSESCELVPQEKKRPNSCRQVSSSLRPRHNKLEQSFTLLGEKTPSIHSRHRSKSHSQHKHKATMTINQLEQGKVQHILRCLNKLK